MKKWAIAWSIVILAMFAVNAVAKTTHTDVTKTIPDDDSGVWDYTMFSALDSSISSEKEQLALDYDNFSVIAKVTATGWIEQRFNATLMECVIQEVYRGDPSLAGKTVRYVTLAHFNPETKTLNGGSINFMKEGYDYLIFMFERNMPIGWKDDGYLYFHSSSMSLFSSYLTAQLPYFCFSDGENIVPLGDEFDSMYGPTYGQLAGNEVFVRSQTALNVFLDLKRQLFETYVQ